MYRKRDQIEEPNLLPGPGREATESEASKRDPRRVILAELVKFSITA